MPLFGREELPDKPIPFVKHEAGCLIKLLLFSCIGGGVIAAVMGGGISGLLADIDVKPKNSSNNWQNNNSQPTSDYGLGESNGGGFLSEPDSHGCTPFQRLANAPGCDNYLDGR